MPPKLKGYEFHEVALKKAKFVVAPMVEGSELAWRMLARRYGAQLCFTPMWHAGVFVRDEKYRIEALKTCPEDRPLIVQFCANDPDIFKKAVELTIQMIDCDAIDLNLGCPQVIAKRGHFGSYLQDEWELITRLVGTIHDNFEVPITCKLRVFEDREKTVAYAKMMESAGAQLLTVHGRTREQKGPLTGLANWDYIKAVKDAVRIPVYANGNIQSLEDVGRCIKETGVDGVMSAESHLTNPALFAGINPPIWEMCLEYLDLVERYPCPLSYSRGHMFKMLHHALQMKANFDIRMMIAKGSDLSIFRQAVLKLKDRMLPFHLGEVKFEPPEELNVFRLKFPPWICQPYVRPPPEEHLKKLNEIRERDKNVNNAKRNLEDSNIIIGPQLSKRQMKRMERNPRKKFSNTPDYCKICTKCPNPAGTKCTFEYCRICCKEKCFTEEQDCIGHKILVKTRRTAARNRDLNAKKE